MADGIITREFAGRAALTLAVRRARPGCGSDIWGLLEEGRTVEQWWIDADTALDGTPHAVIGGVAAAAYMPQRFTKDMDFVVATYDANSLKTSLLKQGWRPLHALNLGPPLSGTAYTTRNGHDVDVLYLPPRFAEPLIHSAQRNKIDGMPTATLPWLTFLKLLAGRIQDTSDIGRMLGHQPADRIEAVRRLVRERLPNQLDDLDQIIALGRMEYGSPRAKRRRGSR